MKTKATLCLILFCGFATHAMAQSSTGRVKITGVRTGWNSDQVAVITSGTLPNPASCPSPDGVILTPSIPGYKTHYATILTAIAADKEVEITVANAGCTSGRPTFWGVNMY